MRTLVLYNLSQFSFVNCRFDIQFAGDKYTELKSYGSSTITNFMASNDKFKRQFKAYLQNAQIDNISDLEYVFNGLKTDDLVLIKQQFQKIFQQDVNDFFDLLEDTNEELLNNLNIIDYGSFNLAVGDLNHSIYNFIKIF